MVAEESRSWFRNMHSDNKKLWQTIDWNGNYSRQKPPQHPTENELQTHFQDLYDCKFDNEKENINNLQSAINIPELDKAINSIEVKEALKDMKSGVFDFR